MRYGALTILSSILLFAAAQGRVVRSPEFGFTMTIPDDFTEIRDAARPPDALYVFARGDVRSPQAIVTVSRMHGVLGPDPLDAAHAPSRPGARVYRERWKGLEVDAFSFRETVAGKDFVTRNVQIPLVPEAVQLQVS